MRLQIIIQLRPNTNIGTFFNDLPNVFLPVFWFDAEASITEDIASQLNLIGKRFPSLSDRIVLEFVVGSMPKIAEVLGISTFLAGLFLAGVFLFLTFRKTSKQFDSTDTIVKTRL